MPLKTNLVTLLSLILYFRRVITVCYKRRLLTR
jgi:hypothetical protein